MEGEKSTPWPLWPSLVHPCGMCVHTYTSCAHTIINNYILKPQSPQYTGTIFPFINHVWATGVKETLCNWFIKTILLCKWFQDLTYQKSKDITHTHIQTHTSILFTLVIQTDILSKIFVLNMNTQKLINFHGRQCAKPWVQFIEQVYESYESMKRNFYYLLVSWTSYMIFLYKITAEKPFSALKCYIPSMPKF